MAVDKAPPWGETRLLIDIAVITPFRVSIRKAFSPASYGNQFTLPPVRRIIPHMIPVEKIKYTIWAADTVRATAFYTGLFGAVVVRQNPHITELDIAGGLIAIHSGGEAQRTWTGITLQVPDVAVGAAAVRMAGGQCPREPEPEGGEPPHLAMCIDTEGNEFMLTRDRSK